MNPWLLLVAAALLSLERLCYGWIASAPDAFHAVCTRPAIARFGKPVDIVQQLFYIFKGLQFAVFFGWCYVYGQAGPALHGGVVALGVGGVLLVAGQILNFGVFYRLGTVGVFYGNKLGYTLPWCQAFPFSLLAHPQYVGTVLSIWGFFLVMRFPHGDWYILPMLETVYYAVGTYYEQ